MKFIIGNVLYEFKIAQEDALSLPDSGEFQVDLKFRKFRSQSRSPEIVLRRSFRLPRADAEASIAPLMADTLEELEVPSQVGENMATHLKFYLGRLSRRNSHSRQSVSIPVKASVDVREISAEKASEIQRRMGEGRTESDRPTPAPAEEVTASPARKSAVEALERERVMEEVEKECGICLERYAVGEEVIRMPCFHVYHTDCIIRWLQKNHFCPFCHFKLPCFVE